MIDPSFFINEGCDESSAVTISMKALMAVNVLALSKYWLIIENVLASRFFGRKNVSNG